MFGLNEGPGEQCIAVWRGYCESGRGCVSGEGVGRVCGVGGVGGVAVWAVWAVWAWADALEEGRGAAT